MPVSKKQLKANRLNAKKSTGPKTKQGKAISSRNSLKHGLFATKIIFNSANNPNDKTEFELLTKNLTDELKPKSNLENYIVYKIAVCIWRANSILSSETTQINNQINNIDNNTKLKNLKNQLSNYSTENIPPELQEQYNKELSNLVGVNSISHSKSLDSLLAHEQHLDSQLVRYYTLLRQIQIESYFESIQNRYKKT